MGSTEWLELIGLIVAIIGAIIAIVQYKHQKPRISLRYEDNCDDLVLKFRIWFSNTGQQATTIKELYVVDNNRQRTLMNKLGTGRPHPQIPFKSIVIEPGKEESYDITLDFLSWIATGEYKKLNKTKSDIRFRKIIAIDMEGKEYITSIQTANLVKIDKE